MAVRPLLLAGGPSQHLTASPAKRAVGSRSRIKRAGARTLTALPASLGRLVDADARRDKEDAGDFRRGRDLGENHCPDDGRRRRQ
jgi:hypothetical protein